MTHVAGILKKSGACACMYMPIYSLIHIYTEWKCKIQIYKLYEFICGVDMKICTQVHSEFSLDSSVWKGKLTDGSIQLGFACFHSTYLDFR